VGGTKILPCCRLRNNQGPRKGHKNRTEKKRLESSGLTISKPLVETVVFVLGVRLGRFFIRSEGRCFAYLSS
jgi:hypothetical protein